MFETIGIIGKHGDPRVESTLTDLVAFLAERHLEVLLDAETATAAPDLERPVVERDELGRRCDLVIVVAGDGTFLGAARSLVDSGVPLLGVNLGRLGFLADIGPKEMTERLGEVLAGEYQEEMRFLLQVTVMRDGAPVISIDALNEVAAHKWNIARLLTFQTRIDGRLVSSQRSDGLIVATPTGSTAYALSGGGPILHATLDAMVLVPICPHTLSSRPLVVAGDSRIEITIDAAHHSEAQLTADGQTVLDLSPGDLVVIGRKAERLRLIHPRSYDYFATLRAKLHWSREL